MNDAVHRPKCRAARSILLMVLAFAVGAVAARAEHAVFRAGDPLPVFVDDFVVCPDAAELQTVTVTLAGDCTLGGTESAHRQAGGFVRTVLRQGMAYPFSGLLPLFSEDDLSLVNLEGVLSDSAEGRNTKKAFAFRGPSSFAEILSLGSVEAVNLSNNHFDDYGAPGREATLRALGGEGVAYAGSGWMCVYRTANVKIGLMGMGGSLTEAKSKQAAEQISLLRKAGCDLVIASLHAGREYEAQHNASQETAARFLIDAGADAVAGHHPHVPQGIEFYQDRYIFYSLGNCVFGGNHAPARTEAIAARLVFTLRGKRMEGLQVELYPLRYTGSRAGNSFRPVLLSGTEGETALDRVRRDTPFPIPALSESGGAAL